MLSSCKHTLSAFKRALNLIVHAKHVPAALLTDLETAHSLVANTICRGVPFPSFQSVIWHAQSGMQYTRFSKSIVVRKGCKRGLPPRLNLV